MRNLHLWPHAAMENNNYTCFTIVESQNSVLPMEYFRSWEQVWLGDSDDSKYLTSNIPTPNFHQASSKISKLP